MPRHKRLLFPNMETSDKNKLKSKIFEIIFEADTPNGKLFDICLLILILFSVSLVMLESVPTIDAKNHNLFIFLEWVVTIIFGIEYALRIYCVKKPLRYIFSFYGIIDFLSIIPSFASILYPTGKFLASIRILRLFRIFRIFGLTQFMRGSDVLSIALRKSRPKIIVFLSFVILCVVVIGSLMYVIENDHPESGFSSIPISIYWAIVTLTTVGYGDISPNTALGQFLASVVMIIGYGVIAVPTGIVSAESYNASKNESKKSTQCCINCHETNHLENSKYCKNCGELL